MTLPFRGLRDACRRGPVSKGATQGIRGQGPEGGTERLSSCWGKRSAGSLTEEQREAMYIHALLLLSRIWDIHGALNAGDLIEADRLGTEFDEDRHLLHILTLNATDMEAALVAPSPGLHRSLARLREGAAAELANDHEHPPGQLATTTQDTEKARLAVDACDLLLNSAKR
jgi:hypothetical protein